MKTISAGHQTAIDEGSTRIAWTAVLTRPDAQVYRYCSGTRDKIIGGDTYYASPGFFVSNMTCTEGAGVVDTLELTMIASSDMAKADFLTGRWNGTIVEFREFDWSLPASGFIDWPTYRVSDVTPRAGAFVLELRDQRVTWAQDYTLYTGKECQNRLGDFRCQVNLATFTFAFTVTSVSSVRRIFTASGLAQATDYFSNGYLVFDQNSDANFVHAGLQMLILEHDAGGIVTLAVPLLQDIEVGMTGEITAGCLHRLEDCRDKFNNILNMRAPGVHAPTVEELVGQPV